MIAQAAIRVDILTRPDREKIRSLLRIARLLQCFALSPSL